MPIMPSYAYVAKALYDVGADADWEDISPDEQQAHMLMARVAIAAISTWQAQHRPDGSNRYAIQPCEDGYTLYDRTVGSNTVLGVIHDALLAQQIIDTLNTRDVKKDMQHTLNELVEK